MNELNENSQIVHLTVCNEESVPHGNTRAIEAEAICGLRPERIIPERKAAAETG